MAARIRSQYGVGSYLLPADSRSSALGPGPADDPDPTQSSSAPPRSHERTASARDSAPAMNCDWNQRSGPHQDGGTMGNHLGDAKRLPLVRLAYGYRSSGSNQCRLTPTDGTSINDASRARNHGVGTQPRQSERPGSPLSRSNTCSLLFHPSYQSPHVQVKGRPASGPPNRLLLPHIQPLVFFESNQR